MVGDRVVTDKTRLRSISKVYANAQQGNDVVTQISVSDLATLRDGRLNYLHDFTSSHCDRGEVLVGEDIRSDIRMVNPRPALLHQLGYNLQSVRKTLLRADYMLVTDRVGHVALFRKVPRPPRLHARLRS